MGAAAIPTYKQSIDKAQQARRWCRLVKVRYPPSAKKEAQEVSLRHVPNREHSGHAGSYMPLPRIRTDEERFQAALEYATRTLASSLKAVEELLATSGNDNKKVKAVKQFERGVEVMREALASIEMV